MALKQSYLGLIRKIATNKSSTDPQLFGAGVLGDFQATILATVASLSPDATVTATLETIVETANEAADVAQTYAAFKILAANGLLEVQKTPAPGATRKTSARYAITPQGLVALKTKIARMQLLDAYIQLHTGAVPASPTTAKSKKAPASTKR